MAARSRQPGRRNRRSLRRRTVDSLHATVGLGRVVKLVRSIGRIGLGARGVKPVRSIGRIRVPQRISVGGKEALRWLRRIRNRRVATIRRLVDQSITTTRGLPTRASRRTSHVHANAASSSAGRAAEGEVGAAERTAPNQRHTAKIKPAKTGVRAHRTRQRQTKPRQAGQRQDLEQRTIQELREQAREAGIKGRSSMTKDELIKALRSHR